MYKSFLKSELKKWFRDSMMKVMLIYPLILCIIGRFVIPAIAKTSHFEVDPIADYLVSVLILITPLIYGALIGFSILDDRDDKVLTSIRITPLSVHQFISFRLIVGTLLAFIGCIIVMWFSNIGSFTFGEIIALSFLSALATPVSGLIINALAHNKIEGFAVMKGTGTIIIFPIIALYFTDAKEFIFSLAPGFWPAKAISSIVRNDSLLLSYTQYYLIGLIYVIVLNIIVYQIFSKKMQVN
ncbi:ABC transporter permease [Mycoplasmatota bacterium]|nr:ABC transporter permease [Mycoplasmatota bacterium]